MRIELYPIFLIKYMYIYLFFSNESEVLAAILEVWLLISNQAMERVCGNNTSDTIIITNKIYSYDDQPQH